MVREESVMSWEFLETALSSMTELVLANKDPAGKMADIVESILKNDKLPEEVREYAFWSLKNVGH